MIYMGPLGYQSHKLVQYFEVSFCGHLGQEKGYASWICIKEMLRIHPKGYYVLQQAPKNNFLVIPVTVMNDVCHRAELPITKYEGLEIPPYIYTELSLRFHAHGAGDTRRK